MWEAYELLEDKNVRKALGPDGTSNWLLKQCKDYLANMIHSVINSSSREKHLGNGRWLMWCQDLKEVVRKPLKL